MPYPAQRNGGKLRGVLLIAYLIGVHFRGHHSFTALPSLRGLAQRLLPWMVAAMLFAGSAHAAHLHKPDAVRGDDALHCGLCLQFDRLASTPSTPQLNVPAPLSSWASLPTEIASPVGLFHSPYEARGPPRA